MSEKPDFETELVQKALTLAADIGWMQVSLGELADALNQPLIRLYSVQSKSALLEKIDVYFDQACGSEPVDETESLRERVFDLVMLRFEAMEDYREGVLSIRQSWLGHPVRRLKAADRRKHTALWILRCAGEDASPMLKPRALVLAGLLARAEHAWAKEESADFTRTMAQLDRDLRDLEDWGERLRNLRFRKSGKKEAAEKPAAL